MTHLDNTRVVRTAIKLPRRLSDGVQTTKSRSSRCRLRQIARFVDLDESTKKGVLSQEVLPRLDENIKMIATISPVPTPSPRSVQHASGETIKVHGGSLSFLAVGEQTGGAYALVETANHPSTGVPSHVHEREDETWFVLEGEYTFEVGSQTFQARPGDYVFGPRNVPHSYANRTGALARALIMVTPAGFEGFWRESARLGPDAAAHEALGRKYGVQFASKTEK